MPDAPPALIILASDGYANSFSDDEGFFKVATDLIKLLARDGKEKVQERLKDVLSETTRLGSGDDITVGILGCMEMVQRASDALYGKQEELLEQAESDLPHIQNTCSERTIGEETSQNESWPPEDTWIRETS